jgi:thioredoxin reductase
VLVPAPHQHRAPALLDGLGLATTETGHLVIDALGATSVAGIWAAGDLTGPLANVARAIAEGSMCGIAVTRDLVAAQPWGWTTRWRPLRRGRGMSTLLWRWWAWRTRLW